jgi:hypothetical protein
MKNSLFETNVYTINYFLIYLLIENVTTQARHATYDFDQ